MTRKAIIEPFKIKMVEPINFHTRKEREALLKEAGNNLFLVNAQDVTFDFLTDSGTIAMSAAKRVAMMVADESYACSKSFKKFESIVKKLTGHQYVIPTHQGRVSERLLFSVILKPGMKVPSNNHFVTTPANIEQAGAEAVDLVIEEGNDPNNLHPLKGNTDLVKLEKFCQEYQGKIPYKNGLPYGRKILRIFLNF